MLFFFFLLSSLILMLCCALFRFVVHFSSPHISHWTHMYEGATVTVHYLDVISSLDQLEQRIHIGTEYDGPDARVTNILSFSSRLSHSLRWQNLLPSTLLTVLKKSFCNRTFSVRSHVGCCAFFSLRFGIFSFHVTSACNFQLPFHFNDISFFSAFTQAMKNRLRYSMWMG